jgi:hypothetical protein
MMMKAAVLLGPRTMDVYLIEVLTLTATQMLDARAERVMRGLS